MHGISCDCYSCYLGYEGDDDTTATQTGGTMPTTTTLDFQAVWTDIYGATYEQRIALTPDAAWPNQLADELSAHLAWVCEHHTIASYSITSL